MNKELKQPFEVFYFYDPEDRRLRKKLEQHLKPMLKNGIIIEWDDQVTHIGTEKGQEINAHVNTAHIFLLLISPDFISSDYSQGTEAKLALARCRSGEAYAIPIVLRPMNWQNTLFYSFPSLPSNGIPVTLWDNLDLAFEDIALGIRALVEKLLNSTPQIGSTTHNDTQTDGDDSASEQIAIQSHTYESISEQLNTLTPLKRSLDEFNFSQKKVFELKRVHNTLHEIELELEVLGLKLQSESITWSDKRERKVVSMKFALFKKEEQQKPFNFQEVRERWERVKLKIWDLQYFAAQQMKYLDEERFSIESAGIRGPIWIKELFELQASFEDNLKEQNIIGIEDTWHNLIDKCRFHLFTIDRQLLHAVEQLDDISNQILRSMKYA